MTLPTITREEFDARLAQSTEQKRQKRLTFEAQAVKLEDLISQYSAVLERLEAGQEDAEQNTLSERRDDLRNLLTELAERTSAVAASL